MKPVLNINNKILSVVESVISCDNIKILSAVDSMISCDRNVVFFFCTDLPMRRVLLWLATYKSTESSLVLLVELFCKSSPVVLRLM